MNSRVFYNILEFFYFVISWRLYLDGESPQHIEGVLLRNRTENKQY